MRIAIGSDRQGFEIKSKLIKHLESKGYEVIDVGPYDDEFPVDYPIYGEKVGRLVASGDCDLGAVMCATGNGIMIAANKVKGIRCAMAYGDEVTARMKQHNDANVIAFGQMFMEYDDIIRRMDIFLDTPFAGGYHVPRIEQISNIEENKPLVQSPLINKDMGRSAK